MTTMTTTAQLTDPDRFVVVEAAQVLDGHPLPVGDRPALVEDGMRGYVAVCAPEHVDRVADALRLAANVRQVLAGRHADPLATLDELEALTAAWSDEDAPVSPTVSR